MKLYKIKINYDTGDSNSQSPNQETILETEWSNLDIAKENLKRIQEHYKYASGKAWPWSTSKHIIDSYNQSCQSKDWFVKEYPTVSLILKMDNGKDWQIMAFWCGYFEKLNFIEIISEDPDMRIDF